MGDESTIHHYAIYLAQPGGTSLMHLGDVNCGNGACPHSVNVASYGISGGPYVFYVQAVGQPMIKNVLSGSSASYTAP